MIIKKLFLVRHGNAETVFSKNNSFFRQQASDFDKHFSKEKRDFEHFSNGDFLLKELTSEGIAKIKILSKFFKKENIFFDKIISSPSIRTSQTAKIIGKYNKYNIDEITYEDSIRIGENQSYVNIIQDLDSALNTVLIVGHSPTLTEFGEYIVNQPIGHLQPGGTIGISLGNYSWKEINKRNGNLIFVKNFLHGSLELA